VVFVAGGHWSTVSTGCIPKVLLVQIKDDISPYQTQPIERASGMAQVWDGTAGDESADTNIAPITVWNTGPGFLFAHEFGLVAQVGNTYYLLQPRGLFHYGKAHGPIQKNDTGQVDIYNTLNNNMFMLANHEAWRVQVTNPFGDIVDGAAVAIAWTGDEWILTAADCNPSMTT
jgi:hypothetical protein